MSFTSFDKLFFLKTSHDLSTLAQKFNWEFMELLSLDGERNFKEGRGPDAHAYWSDGNLDIRSINAPYPSGEDRYKPKKCLKILRPKLLAGYFLMVEKILENNSQCDALLTFVQEELILSAADQIQMRFDGALCTIRPEFLQMLTLSLSITCLKFLRDDAHFISRKPLTRAFCDSHELHEDNEYFFSYEQTMDPKIMSQVSKNIQARGIAILPGHTPHFNMDGTCSLHKKANQVCYGILWELPKNFDTKKFKDPAPSREECYFETKQIEIADRTVSATTLNFRPRSNVGHKHTLQKTLDHMMSAIKFFHGHPDWAEQVLFLADLDFADLDERVLN